MVSATPPENKHVPPKIDGWKKTFSFKMVSFLGSMLNFGGVLFLSYIKLDPLGCGDLRI